MLTRGNCFFAHLIDPVVVFVSYYFVHVEDKLRRTPEKRAAALIKAMLPFRELVETCVRIHSVYLSDE